MKKEILGIYENPIGTRLEAFETNKDVYGKEYVTYRWIKTGEARNIPIEAFIGFTTANRYRKVGK